MSAFNFLGVDLSDARSLPWGEARVTTLPSFLERYTLHDSRWLRFESTPDGLGIALFAWDTHWTEGRVPYPLSESSAEPLLVVGFDALYQAHFNGDPDGGIGLIVGAAESRLVGPEERLRWVDQTRLLTGADAAPPFANDDTLHHTVVHDVGSGRVDLLHGSVVRLLCLDEQKRPVAIPWGAPEHST